MVSSKQSVATLVREIDACFDGKNIDAFWACEATFRACLDRQVIIAWINTELKRLVSDEHYLGDWLTGEVVLHRGPHCELSITVLSTQSRYLHALPYFGFYAALNDEVLYDRYQLPTGHRNDVFDPSLRLVAESTKRAAPSEVIRLESDRYAYDIKVNAPTPILRLVTRPVRALEWLFSRTTLQAWQANDADLAYTQLRVAANVLGKIAHQSSIEPLRRLSGHPHHAVRWAAIQNLGRLNRSEALIKIREAAADEHPHVRRAAQKTLDRLEGKAGQRE